MKTTTSHQHPEQVQEAEKWLQGLQMEEVDGPGDGVVYLTIKPKGSSSGEKVEESPILCGHYKLPEGKSSEDLQGAVALAQVMGKIGPTLVR